MPANEPVNEPVNDEFRLLNWVDELIVPAGKFATVCTELDTVPFGSNGVT